MSETAAPDEHATQSPRSMSQPGDNPGAGIDYGLFLDCVHCGLCTASCPTYAELGDENRGPRGRIYLMRAVTDERLNLTDEVRGHLDSCLDCRACETACPSGVQYGRLLEPIRVAMEEQAPQESSESDWFRDWILHGLFPYPEKLRVALAPARIAQRLGLDRLAINLGLTKLLPGPMGRMAELLPPLPPSGKRLPEFLPAEGKRRARVGLFTGCVADAMFRPTHWATARVLQKNGCDVVIPQSQACCGAIHYHSGSSEPARELSDANVKAFNLDDLDAVIVNVAGCGSMLKDYGHHWDDGQQESREQFAGKVRDVAEFLDELGLIPPTGEINASAAYQDACHLRHAQQVFEAPRRILRQIPGLKLKEINEGDLCCGAAGTYNLTQPEMS
ncbi:MAG: (Fe-S)-binding protein, partial [Planctomycetales bacterium]